MTGAQHDRVAMLARVGAFSPGYAEALAGAPDAEIAEYLRLVDRAQARRARLGQLGAIWEADSEADAVRDIRRAPAA